MLWRVGERQRSLCVDGMRMELCVAGVVACYRVEGSWCGAEAGVLGTRKGEVASFILWSWAAGEDSSMWPFWAAFSAGCVIYGQSLLDVRSCIVSCSVGRFDVSLFSHSRSSSLLL